jgi:hypothetical protein
MPGRKDLMENVKSLQREVEELKRINKFRSYDRKEDSPYQPPKKLELICGKSPVHMLKQQKTPERREQKEDDKNGGSGGSRTILLPRNIKPYTTLMTRTKSFATWYKEELHPNLVTLSVCKKDAMRWLVQLLDEDIKKMMWLRLPEEEQGDFDAWIALLSQSYKVHEDRSVFREKFRRYEQRGESFACYLTQMTDIWSHAYPGIDPVIDREFQYSLVRNLKKKTVSKLAEAGYEDEWSLNRVVSCIEDIEERQNGEEALLNNKRPYVTAFTVAPRGRGQLQRRGRGFGGHYNNAPHGNHVSPPQEKRASVNNTSVRGVSRGGHRGASRGGHRGGTTRPERSDTPKRCSMIECQKDGGHLMIDCEADIRRCRICGKRNHHQARCPQIKCDTCDAQGKATYICCGNRDPNQGKERR